MPSTCETLTSAWRCRSARTAVRSVFSIASASGESAGAADNVLAVTRPAATQTRNDLERIMLSPRSAKAFARRTAEAYAPRTPSEREQFVDRTLAVGELIEPRAELLEQRQMQVRERRRLRILNVAAALHLSGAAAGDDDRQVDVIVDVRIAHTAAVEHHRVVEQRAAAVRRRLQLLEVVGGQRDVEGVDLRHPRDLLRIVAVVRQRVMRVGDANLRIGARAGFARELEGDDAGHVAL